MSDPPALGERPPGQDETWDFEGTRRQHLLRGLRMTPAERLRWLEETVEEMRQLQGLARFGRPVESSPGEGSGEDGQAADRPAPRDGEG